MGTIRSALAMTATGAAMFVALAAGTTFATAQDADLEQRILQSLTPAAKPGGTRPMVRSLTATPAAEASHSEDRQFLESVKNRSSRSLTNTEREHISAIAKERPSVDVEINFGYSSADVGPTAVSSVTALGKALTSPELKGGTFILAGHTDAKGSVATNQELSERRAEAVKRYLVAHFQIPASTSSRWDTARPS